VDKVVDSLGLVQENSFLAVYIPATNRAFVFRVKSRANKGFERIAYGPLPLPSGTTLATFTGGTVSVPADGVLPAMSLIPVGITFPYTGAYDSTDMWYLSEDYRDRVFHVITRVTPRWLRIDLQIPTGVVQLRFQRDKLPLGIERDWGFSRGVIETVHIPEVHYGYRFANDTNMNVYTFVEFIYGEYIIDIPKDPYLIFGVLSKKVPHHFITLPVNVYDATLREALVKVYGIEGFPVYPIHERDKAVKEYTELLKEVKI